MGCGRLRQCIQCCSPKNIHRPCFGGYNDMPRLLQSLLASLNSLVHISRPHAAGLQAAEGQASASSRQGSIQCIEPPKHHQTQCRCTCWPMHGGWQKRQCLAWLEGLMLITS